MKLLFIFLIKAYQLALSPFIGSCCRFYPTCSDYGLEALNKRPLFTALWLIIKRLARCHPWGEGGVDQVP